MIDDRSETGPGHAPGARRALAKTSSSTTRPRQLDTLKRRDKRFSTSAPGCRRAAGLALGTALCLLVALAAGSRAGRPVSGEFGGVQMGRARGAGRPYRPAARIMAPAWWPGPEDGRQSNCDPDHRAGRRFIWAQIWAPPPPLARAPPLAKDKVQTRARLESQFGPHHRVRPAWTRA